MNPMETAVVTSDQEVANIPALPLHHDAASARADIAAWDALHREEKHIIQERHSHFYTAGRLLLAALFLVMAGFKLTHFTDTVNAVATSGYGDASILVSLAFILELVGGVLLALGLRVRMSAVGLGIYLVMVTVLLNWDQSLAINRALALANCGCIAALLLLTAHGAGGFSLEHYFSRRRAHAKA